jgi:hypothetical protein
MFEGRKLVIATKHEKEKVISPIIEKELGVQCFVATNFDTDELGTFSGEVERKEDPISTARKKCLLAMEATNCDLAIASEGSFGPHPTMYFISADDEFLIFLDKKNNLEIIVREISTETNFNGAEIKTKIELESFLKSVNFPSHAVILKNDKSDFSDLVKGIVSYELLLNKFNEFIFKYEKAYIETDMRALFNPTRMKVIEQATIKLAQKINSICPKCETPGFGITDVKKGLRCELCSAPTESTLSFIHSCQKCDFTAQEKFPHGKEFEDPMYCNFCNA